MAECRGCLTLRTVPTGEAVLAGPLFHEDVDIFVGRAPGRLDVMGGIADYSGSLVLQLPLAIACHAAVQMLPASGMRHLLQPAEGGLDSHASRLMLQRLLPWPTLILRDAP